MVCRGGAGAWPDRGDGGQGPPRWERALRADRIQHSGASPFRSFDGA